MSRLRKRAATLALLATLFVSGSALAAPGDDARRDHFGSWLKSVIVRVLEDIRANFPPG
jgi:hypothetical protein